ncbi:hypothetical protein [Collimonas sp.]|jgi:hypothetical protein|uniref:hypothetical protein n=1 Tax=Collimonas sp. TaxID=1963772 RepID=UPI002B9C0124|nr:hypothetical protein [Collimonas sp.]HWW08181.1 hypothetical protein [Collimonas sp.]
MKLIRDGNFIYPVKILLFLLGAIVVILSFNYVESATWSTVGIAVGLAIAAIGGYSSQAHMLKIKPFDNAYKKAKKSYDKKDDQ